MTAFVDRLHQLPQSRRAARGVALVAAVFALIALARLVLVLVAEPVLPVSATASVPAAATPTPIADWHLFGVAGNAPRATALAGLVRGTLARPDPAQGLVFLAMPDGGDRSVPVGEALPGGGVLAAVYPDRLVVRHGAREETILLADEVDPPAVPPAPGADLAVLAAAGQVVPVREQGQVVGLRVTTTDVAQLERLGLRRDDVITAINGVPVREADLGAARMAALLQGARPTLRLRRGGRILELTPGT